MTDQLEGQVTLSDLGIWCGKTFPEPCPQTKAETSKPSSRKSQGSHSRMHPMCLCLKSGRTADVSTMSWEDGALLGEYTMHSTGEQPCTLMTECSFPERPNGVGASQLSQILVDSPLPKYSLSAKACLGILRRAKEKNKPLPPELEAALTAQAKGQEAEASQTISFLERAGKPGGGKGILVQTEKVGTLSTCDLHRVLRGGRSVGELCK